MERHCSKITGPQADSFHQSPHQAVPATRLAMTPGWRCVITTFSDPSQALEELDVEKNRVIYPSVPPEQSSTCIATKEELQNIENAHPLPLKPSNAIVRNLRWNFFSMYRKMFALVFTLNMIAVIVFLSKIHTVNTITTYAHAATAASANLCVGVLMRNEHVVNLLFRAACSLPLWAPLAIRRQAAKVYSYGGVHSGCGASGAVWYIIFSTLVVNQFGAGGRAQTALAVTTGTTLVLILLILAFAHPVVRMKLHDQFEATHRYGGWAAIACLWLQTMVLVLATSSAEKRSFGAILVQTPPFWFLAIITVCLVYPWTRLRSRKVHVEYLSKHATRLHFDYANMGTCLGVRLTDSPLRETHGFATIPNYEGVPGFTVLISNAGDWTNKIISDPPTSLWVKGAPTLGVMRVALMFKKVLVISTGSGIGPCLSLLQSHPDYPMRVIWSAQSPQSTYGAGIIASVFRADPDAIIVDTKKTGRGNLLALAYSMFIMSEAEAAIVISNPIVTKKVVYGLEARGIPAYGPIFDS